MKGENSEMIDIVGASKELGVCVSTVRKLRRTRHISRGRFVLKNGIYIWMCNRNDLDDVKSYIAILRKFDLL